MKLEHEAIKGPNGYYWIVTARHRDIGIAWAILGPTGSVFAEGTAIPRNDDMEFGRRETVKRCRRKLQRYFDKWTSHNGIPVPP